MPAPTLQTKGLQVRWGDRILVQGLNMTNEREMVALVGRNGVGKSSLLSVLAGEHRATEGEVTRRGEVFLVPQVLPPGNESPGERRRHLLEQARTSNCDLLLLDEPTQDLDQEGVEWLRWWLSGWEGGCLVATHDRRLLRSFEHFFRVAESGCRYLGCSFAELEEELEKEHKAEESRYLSRLNEMVRREEHTLHIARRRRRKKQYGRVREMDRATPRATLNQKRSSAQVSHGRINKAREAKLQETREWTRTARQALRVELPLETKMPALPEATSSPLVKLEGVGVTVDGRRLFSDISLALYRNRLSVTGPNGAGKTTLLEIMIGKREPDEGSVERDDLRIGFIEQGGENWMLSENLLDYLEPRVGHEQTLQRVADHKFPLALAHRPLLTLSPGERVRAALIALLSHNPLPELLVLDEPTYSLDLLGQRALTEFLKAWPGGLVVASHDRDFLEELDIDQRLAL
jgi:ATPase subunit of ABC transporter with duplicated ATPase domains